MSIKILNPGLMTTVQDLGRFGSQKYGVIVSGAMDPISLRIANLLVGNDQGEGAIEITLYGTTLEFEQDHLIAITGGNLQPTIDGKTVPMWRPIFVQKGSVLQFKSAITGCRAYVAFAGGVAIPKEMGSKSTYLRAKIGGYHGRALQKGDILKCGKKSETSKSFSKQLKKMKSPFTWFINYSSFFTFNKVETIRILKGSEFECFDKMSQHHFVKEPYILTTKADRMGYQLKGEKLTLSEKFELLSEGVTYGTIQVPSNGLPIILMADRQTTGGYPKIGQVITADLSKLAQMQPTNKVKFEIVSLDIAEEELIYQEEKLNELSLGIYLKSLDYAIS